jgi:hypothetical protein
MKRYNMMPVSEAKDGKILRVLPPFPDESETGKWVEYSDHEAALADLQSELAAERIKRECAERRLTEAVAQTWVSAAHLAMETFPQSEELAYFAEQCAIRARSKP